MEPSRLKGMCQNNVDDKNHKTHYDLLLKFTKVRWPLMQDGKTRIVLQFCDYDFRHRKVLEILNSQPRRKTDFVVNAVLHFISCPNAGQEYDKAMIRSVVKDVIKEMLDDGTISGITSDKRQTEADNAVISELGDVMDAFR